MEQYLFEINDYLSKLLQFESSSSSATARYSKYLGIFAFSGTGSTINATPIMVSIVQSFIRRHVEIPLPPVQSLYDTRRIPNPHRSVSSFDFQIYHRA
ncbi:hypothetical protein ARMSODRAFT_961663 [Armillaria solidipes]|uniref:Uncharacterized protein n=1 Tax=Armillaria solidipes TaxID=1076256 RepID=A0A2H3BFL3_9AGAR|nr:hypothetical protein ARMSODRAFT_961663 [Armillaria solidipes]